MDATDYTVSERGFSHMRPIPGEYGGDVRVHESSAADGPCIWLRATVPVDLNDPDGPVREVASHLTAESAWRLADQLRWLVEHHYQGDTRPRETGNPPPPAPPPS